MGGYRGVSKQDDSTVCERGEERTEYTNTELSERYESRKY